MSKATSTAATEAPATYGIMAEFTESSALIHAAEHLRDAGYTKVEAYTPIPVHGLDVAIGHKPSRLPWLVLAGGLASAVVLGSGGSAIAAAATTKLTFSVLLGPVAFLTDAKGRSLLTSPFSAADATQNLQFFLENPTFPIKFY